MFLSDVSYLQKLNSQKQISLLESTKTNNVDQYELELERLYSTSPLITEWSSTYQLGELYKAESEDGFKKMTESAEALTPISFLAQETTGKTFEFNPIEVPKVNPEVPSQQSSGLTKLIEQNAKEFTNASNKGKLRLTIYLPDFSDMQVYASMDSTIGELIKTILKQHESEDLDPPLDYSTPNRYELRMHEGDGEPDRDFPAYNLEQLLRNIESDEFCLCEIEDNKQLRTYSVHDSLFFSPGAATSSEKSFTTGSSNKVRDRERDRERRYDPYSPEHDLNYSDDELEGHAPPPNMENSVTINFPDGKTLILNHEENSTLRDLLPTIAKTYRLRLYTDEYEFLISPQDQKLLGLMSQAVDSTVPIYTIGTRVFDIQKKLLADACKRLRQGQSSRHSRKHATTADFPVYNQAANMVDDISITFTEATANAYQQWNVVKKNKFGIKQERIFGVDGKKVYNAKRGQLRSANSGVQRAERDITSIVKIEKLPTDPKTFRITWMDNGDIYYIEYTCETTRECAEIVAKIKYILTKNYRK